MNAQSKIIGHQQLRPGDILLCPGHDKLASAIASCTKSRYTHAAICYSATEAVESVGAGVRKLPILTLVARYPRVAVFRSPIAWNPSRVGKLRQFLDLIIGTRARYNFKAVMSFVKRRQEHNRSLHSKISQFFNGNLMPRPYRKGRYFCSELIVDCFIAVGFITPGAAIAYQSDTFSPGDIGRDGTFGAFVGYLQSTPSGNIPEDDEFYHNPTFAEIWPNHFAITIPSTLVPAM